MKNDLLSKLAIGGGIAAIAAPLCLSAFSPKFPIWAALLVGSAVGSPLLFLGFQLSPASDKSAPKRFWPTQSERWGMVGILAIAATFIVPSALIVQMFALVPAGDNWTFVIVRITLVVVVLGASYWWIGFARKRLTSFFRGKLSDATLDTYAIVEQPKEVSSVREAALLNWQLLATAAFAFAIAYSVMNFNNPIRVVEGSPRRLRGIIQLLVWCQGNSNTVFASSLLVGVCGMGLYVYRVFRASVQGSHRDNV